MAELITTIILTSGTRVNLPIFPQITSSDYTIITRANTPHVIYRGSVLEYQRLSDADLLEFASLIANQNYSAIYPPTISEGGYWIGNVGWVYMPSYNGYRLQSCFKGASAQNGVTYNLYKFGRGNQSDRYYNSENPDLADPFRNFYDHINEIETHPAYYKSVLQNCRSGGGDYAFDLAACNAGEYEAMGAYIANAQMYTLQQLATNISNYINTHPNSDITVIAFDPDSNDDPYIVDDPSTFGGGDGSHEDPDEIEKASIPALPTIGAMNTGLVTMYGATNAQLQALGGYLWSNLWDIETNFKKLYSDPMDCLVGLSILPCTPSMGGAANVKFGNITTNIALNILSSQYVEVDCGTVNIKEYIGCFLDYSPYVNISIYLPYVGYRELSPDDVMNDSIHVVYHVDCLTGACTAMIETGNKGLLYSYNGSCSCNVPLTAINYSGAIQNAVSAVGAGLTTVAGAATGAAPIAAAGAMGMLSNAANTAINSKPSVQRSGAMGGAAGLMSNQKPLLVITRPRKCVPDKLNKFIGLTTHVTMKLNQCKGFTQIELIHLDNVPCTDDERDELLTLLQQGVIF